MFGTMDLDQVLRHQAELRREAAQHRLAAKANRHQPRTTKARRVFGLRLSPA